MAGTEHAHHKFGASQVIRVAPTTIPFLWSSVLSLFQNAPVQPHVYRIYTTLLHQDLDITEELEMLSWSADSCTEHVYLNTRCATFINETVCSGFGTKPNEAAVNNSPYIWHQLQNNLWF